MSNQVIFQLSILAVLVAYLCVSVWLRHREAWRRQRPLRVNRRSVGDEPHADPRGMPAQRPHLFANRALRLRGQAVERRLEIRKGPTFDIEQVDVVPE